MAAGRDEGDGGRGRRRPVAAAKIAGLHHTTADTPGAGAGSSSGCPNSTCPRSGGGAVRNGANPRRGATNLEAVERFGRRNWDPGPGSGGVAGRDRENRGGVWDLGMGIVCGAVRCVRACREWGRRTLVRCDAGNGHSPQP